MPISTISQTISNLPPAGKRGVDVQTVFVNKQEDFQDHLQGTTVGELNTLKTQLNTTVEEMNTAVTQVNNNASSASTSASTATTQAGIATTKAGEANISATSASNSSTKAGQWAENNYNVEVESGKYSAKHWSTVAQNTVNNKVDKVTSTDNAIVRFDGTTGAVQNSSVTVDDVGSVGLEVVPVAGTTLPTLFGSYLMTAGIVENSSLTNASYQSGEYKYLTTGSQATAYGQSAGYHTWSTAPVGTAGSVVPFTEVMCLDSSGNLGIGNAAPVFKLDVTGTNGNGIRYTNGNVGAILGIASAGVTAQVGSLTNHNLELLVGSLPRGILDISGNLVLTTGTGGLGYGTGAGGTVIQPTSKSTSVTLNKPSGTITMNNTALASNTTVAFLLFNSLISSTDDVRIVVAGGISVTNSYEVRTNVGANGGCDVIVKNVHTSSLSESLVLRFTIIKGAIA